MGDVSPIRNGEVFGRGAPHVIEVEVLGENWRRQPDS